jgi:hypothetical protein
MFASSPGDVTPRTRKGIGVEKTMFTIFFTNTKLLVAEDLPKGQKHNQDYFISENLLELEHEKMRYKRGKQDGTFYGHLDHSKSFDSGKIQGKFDMKGLARALYPLYSRDLSPCDFWFFGMDKGKMKDRKFHTVRSRPICVP